MRKTLRVTAKHNAADLHALLQAAGIPVVTIRSEWANGERDVCLCSVIVFEDGYDPAANMAAMAAKIAEAGNLPRVVGKSIPADPVGFDREASLRRHEQV